MPPLAGAGSMLRCTMGAASVPLVVPPGPPHLAMGPSGVPIATVNDHIPVTNIPSFGMCASLANPAVQTAHAPAPCVPVTPSPWVPATTVLIAGIPAIGIGATCQCQWVGTITVLGPPVTTAATAP